jgi:hypothetical protein
VGVVDGVAAATSHPATAKPLGPRGNGSGGEYAIMLLLSDSIWRGRRAVKNRFFCVVFKRKKTPHENRFFAGLIFFQRP